MCALWKPDKQKEAADKRSRQFIAETLTDALDQRAKMRLTFEDTTTSIKDISGSLVGFNSRGVLVEVSSLKKASQAFVAATVSCYFRVRVGGETPTENFYTFNSRVQSVHMQDNGVVAFVLASPTEIMPAQQRRSVRVSVDLERMPMCMVWRELPGGADITAAPPLLSCNAQRQGQLKVDNISSYGLRLIVPNAVMSETLPRQEPGEVFSFYFKAVAEEETPIKAFLACAVLRNTFSDPQTGETSLGFEFVAEGRLNKEKRLVWTRLPTNELPGLSPFVFKWNLLDFYRDKRVDA
jgi:c-di-GMP-binding flagellar brake protein YcgR